MTVFFEKNLQTPSGILVSEVEIARFFTIYNKLKLSRSDAMFRAYCGLIDKLVRVEKPLEQTEDSANSSNSTT